MKKTLSVLAGIAILASTLQMTFAYTLTNDDTAIVDRATNAIEKMITKKGENYRARYLRALRALQLRYTGNERIYTIVGETIENINNPDSAELANVFGNIATTPSTTANNTNTTAVGGQKDANGCLTGAGYSWCSVTQKCIRSWEEKCVAPATSSTAPTFTSLDISPITVLPMTAGKEAVFNANVTSTNAGDVKFVINWGDGTPNTEYSMNMMANAQGTYSPRHTFMTAGQYWVDGTVTSSATGLSTKAGIRVNIQSQSMQKINISMNENTLSWNSLDSVSYYKLEITSSSNDAYSIVSSKQTANSYYLANANLTNGSYYVYVNAYNSTGNQIGAGNLTIQYTKSVSSRYPGCDKDDVIIGKQFWSSCNYNAVSSGQIGGYVPWGSLGGDFVTNGWYVISTSMSPSGNSGDVGPCAIGYHVPALEEAQYAVSQAGGGMQFFEKIGALPTGYYTTDGRILGKDTSPIYWLASKYPYSSYFTAQDDTLPGSAFGLDTAGVPTITSPMRYVNNNFTYTQQLYLGKGAKAQIRCVKNY